MELSKYPVVTLSKLLPAVEMDIALVSVGQVVTGGQFDHTQLTSRVTITVTVCIYRDVRPS